MVLRTFLAALSLAALATPAAAADAMSDAEVEKLLSGNSTQGKIVIESPLLDHEFRRHFAADGRLVSHNVTKGEGDKGTWRVTPSGALCMKHDTWAQGREYCTLVERAGQGYRRIFKGKPSEEMKVLPGDAFGLLR
jgi:hypothetical protein